MNTQQRGFTLVELLIALLVSSTLAAGLGQILLQSKKTYKTQLNLSHMMEDGRYALEILTKETRRIGYLRNRFAGGSADGSAVGSAIDVFPDDPAVLDSNLSFTAGEYIRGEYNSSGFYGSPYDVNHVVFRYQLNDAKELSAAAPDYAASPCVQDIYLEDDEDPTKDRHVVTIYLYVDLDPELNTPTLYCKAKREIVKKNTDGTVTKELKKISVEKPKPLLANIERFLILYGIDTDNDGAANVYLRADHKVDWTRVVSIRPYIVLASEETNVTQNSPSYQIEDQRVVPDTPSDRRLYRVFSTTITVRNY